MSFICFPTKCLFVYNLEHWQTLSQFMKNQLVYTGICITCQTFRFSVSVCELPFIFRWNCWQMKIQRQKWFCDSDEITFIFMLLMNDDIWMPKLAPYELFLHFIHLLRWITRTIIYLHSDCVRVCAANFYHFNSYFFSPLNGFAIASVFEHDADRFADYLHI